MYESRVGGTGRGVRADGRGVCMGGGEGTGGYVTSRVFASMGVTLGVTQEREEVGNTNFSFL